MGFLVRIGLVAGFVASMAAAGADPAPEKTFEQWVAMAEAGEAGVDYTALRQAYVRSPGYSGYGMDWIAARQELIAAANAKDCTRAFAIADTIRKADYTYPLLHLTIANCYMKAGDTEHAKREYAVFDGLKDSIFASGDGKSLDTAFVVVTMSEERFVLIMRNLDQTRQALLNKDGHAFDRIDGTYSDSGEAGTLYFNVDAFFGSLTRKTTGQ